MLKAELDTNNRTADLYNMVGWRKGEGVGSHQYKGDWGFLDQIIVSKSLLMNEAGIQTWFNQANVFKGEFLLTKNEKYGTMEPFRTYGGKNYLGGYSDHLPVYVDLWYQ